MYEYENLHAHTYLSNALIGFPDSPASQEDYAKRYKELGLSVLSFSEHGYRGDTFEAADLAAKYDMKALPSAEVYFVPNRKAVDGKFDGRNFHLLIVGSDNEAFQQLNYALSLGNYADSFYKHGRLDFELLESLDPSKFLVTTACLGGIFKDPDGEKYAERLHSIFKDNFFLEVQPHLVDKQIELNSRISEMAKAHNWNIIAGTDSHYILKEDKILREELIRSKKEALDESDSEFDLFVPTPEELAGFYKAQDVLNRSQIEEALENTLRVRDFAGFTYDTTRKFPISNLSMSEDDRRKRYIRTVRDNYIEQFGKPTEEEAAELNKEVRTVCDTKSYDYFLSLYDMLEEGKRNGGVLTKTSRGSAASYATSAALKFTSINRLHEQVKLYPDRFVSKEKLEKAMPDIDSNVANAKIFEEAGRTVFGPNGCFPMVAFNKLKTLSAFKLLCRSHEIDPQIANDVSKQIQNYELDVKHAIENNGDDPDYNVDDDVDINDYVDEQYHDLIEGAGQYLGIKMSISPHPCARLCYHKDLRREIGLISLKPKAGEKERRLACFIEGATADNAGYCKSDLLSVDVVGVINDTFKAIEEDTPSVDDLKTWVNDHPEVWQLFSRGFTMSLNQCERPASTQKIMRLKPKNVVELAAFVAAIRPGAKSLVNDFCDRKLHTYGVPALDKMLKLNGATGVTGESSFLFYDEQILHIAQYAGIEPGDAVTLIKSIKKKKKEKVLHYKETFIPGFTKYLIESEHDNEDHAAEIAAQVWKVIEDSASYLFNASHALAMAYDALYEARLKTIAPYEFYRTILALYTKKHQIEKITATVKEMKRYKQILLSTGRFRQDNRDWYIDKDNKTISQALSSIKNISSGVAVDLYNIKDREFDTFADLLRTLQMETCLDSRQTTELIKLNYFEEFGKTEKLMKVYDYFTECKITKTVKSWAERLTKVRIYEQTLEDTDLPIEERAKTEFDLTGLVYSHDEKVVRRYLIAECESKYGVKVNLVNLATGETAEDINIKKAEFTDNMIKQGDIIEIPRTGYLHKEKVRYVNGCKVKTGEFQWWITGYKKI